MTEALSSSISEQISMKLQRNLHNKNFKVMCQ
jgi:hypothetical protein